MSLCPKCRVEMTLQWDTNWGIWNECLRCDIQLPPNYQNPGTERGNIVEILGDASPGKEGTANA